MKKKQGEDIILHTLQINSQLQFHLRHILQTITPQTPHKDHILSPIEQNLKQLQRQNYSLQADNRCLSQQIFSLKREIKSLRKQNQKLKQYNTFLQDSNDNLKKEISFFINKKKTQYIGPQCAQIELINKINKLKQSNYLKEQILSASNKNNHSTNSQIIITNRNFAINSQSSLQQLKNKIKIKDIDLNKPRFKTEHFDSPRQIKNSCTSCNYSSKPKFKGKKQEIQISGSQKQKMCYASRKKKKSIKQWHNSYISSSDLY